MYWSRLPTLNIYCPFQIRVGTGTGTVQVRYGYSAGLYRFLLCFRSLLLDHNHLDSKYEYFPNFQDIFYWSTWAATTTNRFYAKLGPSYSHSSSTLHGTAQNQNTKWKVVKYIIKGGLSILYLFTGAGMFSLMSYCMFANWVWYAVTVVGLIYWRYKFPDMYRPMKISLIIPVFFTLLCLILLVFSIYSQPLECLAGFGISLIGIPVYYIFIYYADRHPESCKGLIGN